MGQNKTAFDREVHRKRDLALGPDGLALEFHDQC